MLYPDTGQVAVIRLAAGELTPELLQEHGWDAHPSTVKGHVRGLRLEPPVRTSKARFSGTCSMGAFSYAVDGKFYSTSIGRYCSIAKGINIGQFNHPVSFLSTNPTFFQKTFKIKTGSQFSDKREYDNYEPRQDDCRAAVQDVTRTTVIGHDVWIGYGVVVIAGVTIGHGAVIGANSVVTKDIPPYCVVAGAPARIIRKRFPDEIIDRLLAAGWWNYAPWQLKGVAAADPVASLEVIESMVRDDVPAYRPKVLVVD